MKSIYKSLLILALATGGFASCNDYLDMQPLSKITPESFFSDDSQLAAYVDNLYTNILPSHGNWSYGMFGTDSQTDNQTGMNYADKYTANRWKVPHTSSDWTFTNINNVNYFISLIAPRVEAGEFTTANAKHYLGEAYVLRAYEHFKRYQMFGDFPINKEPLPDDLAILSASSVRQPRDVVAKFILEDLDKGIALLQGNNMATTRINADAAILLKSRVALFEGTWQQNFAGTDFVKGCTTDYKEFLRIAAESAKIVAEKMVNSLATNTGIVPQEGGSQAAINAANPYMAVFAAENMSSYPEVLLWRQYNQGLGIYHCVVMATHHSNYGVGVTRGMVDAFVMKNGLPIYAEGSGYHGDKTIADVRADRDPRLTVFLKEPGQKNSLIKNALGTHAVPEEPVPNITAADASDKYVTGYTLRKGWCADEIQAGNGNNYTGCCVFHGVEALLNYMEASYLLNGSLDATAQSYWTAIRERQGMDTDFNKTIAATDINEEAKGDWGAYTAGKLLTDVTLYNIRRERRCEMMAEALRWMDLQRWRALDQMMTDKYHIEGFHIWNTPMESWYTAEQLEATASPKSRSEYMRPYEVDPTSEVYDGYTWKMAHYLYPVPIKQFQLTSTTGDGSDSPLTQNPGWPLQSGEVATK